jgi:hypothetical protein
VSKEIRIGVPGAGPASGVPAFAVSRDSAGILIGVRDNAAPQFAVSRDSGGLLLSACPVSPAALSTGSIKCFTNDGDVTFGMASVRPVSGRIASVRSTITTPRGASNPYLITAPSTIVAGDVLVMGLATVQGDNIAPAGWVLIGELYKGAGYPTFDTSLYTRTATIDDVGAASYAVANAGSVYKWGHIWAIADGREIDFSAFCYEPAPGHAMDEVISADGFAAIVGSVFCVVSAGENAVYSYDFPMTENRNPTWTRDGSDWGFYSAAWHAVWGS